MTDQYDAATVRARMRASAAVQIETADAVASDIIEVGSTLIQCLQSGGKLMFCGNGGSAADAQHVSAELVSLLHRDFDRPALAAMALTTDTSMITAWANDIDFSGVFARQVEGLGRPGDALVVISTSGSSLNLIKAVDAARQRGMLTVGLLGSGGRLTDLVDHAVVVPSSDTQYVQEALLPIEHLLCDMIEQALFSRST